MMRPDMSDDAWTYIDCGDRFYRYKDTGEPYECHGEHNQIQTGGWLVQTWYRPDRWICFENLSLEEDVVALIDMLKRNAADRKLAAKQSHE